MSISQIMSGMWDNWYYQAYVTEEEYRKRFGLALVTKMLI